MNRNEFIKRFALALGAGIPIITALKGCSDDDSPGTSGPNCLENGTNISIGTNHGHSLSIPKTDVELGVEKTYSIAGSAGHNHNVTVSATQFAELQQNQSISVSSDSSGGHSHSVTVTCA